MKETWDAQTNEDLCIEYQETHSDELYEYFLSRNIGLIMDYLSPIIRKHPDQKEELVQTCKVAMWEAMCNFKLEKEVKFTTYVYYFFKKNVWHYWHSQYSVHIPINLMGKINEVKEKMPYVVFDSDSLDKTICFGDEGRNEFTLDELVAADQPSPEDIAIQNDNLEYLLKLAREHLTPRSLNLLILRYGLDGGEPKTLQEIGNMYHVTRERIRQVLDKALEKLKIIYLKEKLDEEKRNQV